ncbi:OpgC domain-containing protein [Thalassotalea sediminis]|uniref:OpgC domain-containing protein n=1 Tax=Thalassotalea sediminis TaxID=1759089 RepID=UPI00257351B3|nr:OpgC domain-containing protein [Thalassotalea sediminis]
MARVTEYDGLRGWLLIIIACNHLWGEFVSDFTRAPLGYVSAAEAFVFLSGYVAYFVYRKLHLTPIKQAKKILFRTLTIYLFHICAITITFTLIFFFPFYKTMWNEFFLAGNFYLSVSEFALASALLLEHPGYHDILIMYLFAMFFLPLTMVALKHNHWFLVLIVSIFCWLLAPIIELSDLNNLYNVLFPSLTMQISYFDPMAWQLYFYIGVLLSYAKFERNINFEFTPIVKVTLVSLAVVFMIAKHTHQFTWLSPFVANSGYAPIGLVINLLVLSYVFMLWMRHFPWLFNLKYPIFLGQHALPVFSFHTIVVYFLLPAFHPNITHYWYWDLAACALFVATLWIPASLDDKYHQYKKSKLTPVLI